MTTTAAPMPAPFVGDHLALDFVNSTATPDGVRVVSGLHTVSAALLTDLGHALDEDVLICGDRKADKAQLAALIERVPGLRCVDCGRLEMARITESLTPLIISMNVRYKARAGIKVTGLPAELWPASSS